MPNLLNVDEALQIVLQHARRLPKEAASLTSALLGLVLAEDVIAEHDSPPFAKSLVDGFAVRSSDGQRDRRVVMEIVAGTMPERDLGTGEAARITTGAPLPAGADAVVMQEHVEPAGPDSIRILGEVRAGQNILPQGAEMRRGEMVLSSGTAVRPQEIGVLASLGKTAVWVHRQPLVAVLPTGDELVEPGLTPGPGQIRNSNAAMLAALIARAGGLPRYLGIGRDSPESLRPLVREGLKCDALVISGGMSVGPLDLVPRLLAEEHVIILFHQVALKPGKPLLFGVRDRSLVFGLPGNPVSSFVGFELFVRPAIRVMLGKVGPYWTKLTACWSEAFRYRTDRPTYYPVRLWWENAGWRVQAVPWLGSADLRALCRANAFACLPAGESQFAAGDAVDVLVVEPPW
ncbi:MAG: molybdopterin molybdotransferase MoeA [Gemmatales bacterium]|nr:molybdopterin molybdotransferase MoeA [Gemmatales bacterium]MDW8176645.1 molybdopterin molybdotransferase MoeA [Gemmatales bacterium]